MGALLSRFSSSKDAKVAAQDEESVASISSQDSLASGVDPKASGYVDPPMPLIGEMMDINVLVKRNRRVQQTFLGFLDAVEKDTKEACLGAKNVPVADVTEKNLVTEGVRESMAKTRSRKQIRMARDANINEIQKGLALRMRTIELMNENIAGVIVGKIEPVFIREARTVVIHPN